MIAPHADWGDETSDDSIAKLKAWVEDYWKLKVQCDLIEADLKQNQRARDEIKAKVQERMEEEGLVRFDSDNCFITVNEERYVTVPRTQEQKEALFAWLRAQGAFYDYASINYQSLQSLYKEQKKISGSSDFSLPGIEPEKRRFKLRSYKQKKTER